MASQVPPPEPPSGLTTEENTEYEELSKSSSLTEEQFHKINDLKKKMGAPEVPGSRGLSTFNVTQKESKDIIEKIKGFFGDALNWVKRNEGWIKPALIGIALLLGAAALIAAIIGSHGIFVFVIVGAAVATAAIAFAIQMFITKPREDLQQSRTALNEERKKYYDNFNTLKSEKQRLEEELVKANDGKLAVIKEFVKDQGDENLKKGVAALCLAPGYSVLKKVENLVNLTRKQDLEEYNNKQMADLNKEILSLEDRINKKTVEFKRAKADLDRHDAKIENAQKAIDAFAPEPKKAKTPKVPNPPAPVVPAVPLPVAPNVAPGPLQNPKNN